MPVPEPIRFARDWVAAWNARDVEAVLAHFHEDAMFSSPIAERLGHGIRGTVRGKHALRAYWTAALALNRALRFSLGEVHAGIDTIVICFTTQDGTRRAEVLVFEDGLVARGYATTEAEPA